MAHREVVGIMLKRGGRGFESQISGLVYWLCSQARKLGNLPLQTFSNSFPHPNITVTSVKMADEMGTVITIDNFTTSMSQFNPGNESNHLYGLVDMATASDFPSPTSLLLEADSLIAHTANELAFLYTMRFTNRHQTRRPSTSRSIR